MEARHEIKVTPETIKGMLSGKFYIDYFQREYRWEDKHIKTLIDDFVNMFFKSYDSSHARTDVMKYESYYLGTVVFSINTETQKKSIIDGQQRITSITLFLIYLNHKQKEFSNKVSIADLIFSDNFGIISFNMSDESRDLCLKSLFENGDYELSDADDETNKNILNRYKDIDSCFPEDWEENTIVCFIEWFIRKVLIVEITAFSEENAYTIFETMNDRGLSLTPTEMLKGYVLSRITNKEKRNKINEIWKEEIKKLHSFDKDTDLKFFHAWFRSKYAITIRQGKIGSQNQDFELITRFHNWFKDNHEKLFNLKTSDDFYEFFKSQFPFFVKIYIKILKTREEFNNKIPHLNYVNSWGIAESLQEALLLAPIKHNEEEITIFKKLDAVARYIETFTVRRSINYKKFGQTAIRHAIFKTITSIRNSDLNSLFNNLKNEIEKIDQKWNAINDFRLHGMNKKFVKHLLCRISGYIDALVGKNDDFHKYHKPTGKFFEIEHILADKFEDYKTEFEQKIDFQNWRNNIGALILLPNGTNQSFSSKKYQDKINHYLKENTFAQTLHSDYYLQNPNFLKSEKIKELTFESHANFLKEDIKKRNQLVQRICEQIWSTDYYEQKT